MKSSAESQRHRVIGTILMVLAGVCVLAGVTVMLFVPKGYMGVITFVIIAMILGSSGFGHFEKYAQYKPESPIRHEMELFGTSLKNQSPVSIFLELHYPVDQDSPYVLDRIRAHFQRSLNISFLQIDRLPENPYSYIDALLAAETPHLCNELNLRTLTVKTIDVHTSPPSAAGIRLRST